MDLLAPVLFHDAWGSHVSIASMQGREIPTDQPESELWMGAHESGPCPITRDGVETTLLDAIRADPTRELGPQGCEVFGGRLPFLLKVLAPGRAISIQVHPTAEQAQEVRAADAQAGDPDTTYVDDWAKPELLVAISPFTVFVGMREHAASADLATRLRVPDLVDLVAKAATEDDPEHALLAAVLAVPAEQHARLARQVVAACVRLCASPDPAVVRHRAQCAAIVQISRDHPDDIGLVVLLLMTYHVLEPGDYIDVPAGVLHSYVSGVGVEVLANSDNVVRAGLTSKPVNADELLRIVDPHAGVGVSHAETDPDLPEGERFPSQSDRFALRRWHQPHDVTVPGDGTPRLIFCLQGEVTLTSPEARLDLAPVQAAYLSAQDHNVTVSGDAEVYVVTLPTV